MSVLTKSSIAHIEAFMPDEPKAEWEQDIQKILKSNRIAEMTFHVPVVDKDM